MPVGDLPKKRHHTPIIFAFDISHAEALSQLFGFSLSTECRIVRHGGKGRLDGSRPGLSAFCQFCRILQGLDRSLFNARCLLSLGVVDADVEVGDVLTLVWGEPDGGTKKTSTERHKQAEIRVRVSPTPYAREARENYADSWRSKKR